MGAPGTTKTVDRERERQAAMTRARPEPAEDDVWNPARIELLKELWPLGLSAGQMAAEINRKYPGAAFTRSAVIGKAYRIPLPHRNKPSKPTTERPARRMASRGTTLKLAGVTVFHEPKVPRLPRETVPDREEMPGLETVMSVRAHQCRWPIGDPQADDFTFCGRRSGEGPYCGEHSAIAYQPTDPKRSEKHLARALRRFM